ncbi:hypothetical protein GCM10027072_78000 [Streptomyces bullii]
MVNGWDVSSGVQMPPPWRRGLVTSSDTIRTAASAAPRGNGRLPQVFEAGSCGIAWVGNGLGGGAVGALTGIVFIWLMRGCCEQDRG